MVWYFFLENGIAFHRGLKLIFARREFSRVEREGRLVLELGNCLDQILLFGTEHIHCATIYLTSPLVFHLYLYTDFMVFNS